jgi:chemotaxis-related protein WspB
MLLTVFTIGGAAYAIDAAQLIEVLPLVHIEPIPHASPAIAGTANYHAVPLVVIDLHRLAGDVPAPRRLTTRILVVRHGSAQVGLLAAGVTDTLKIDPREFRSATEGLGGAVAWLGPRAAYGRGFVQRLEVEPLMRVVGAAA